MDNIVDKLIAKKAELHVTNAWIAEKSRVPESTVTKVLNRTNKSPSFATIIPMAEALGVSLSPQTIEKAEEKIVEQVTEQVTEQIVAEVEKPTPSETIAAELSRQYERLLVEKDRRIADKDKQIRHMWMVIAVLGSLFLLCMVGFVALYVYDYSIPDRGWITQSAEYVGQFTGNAINYVKELFSL